MHSSQISLGELHTILGVHVQGLNTELSSPLEVCIDDVLYKSTYTLLTLLKWGWLKTEVEAEPSYIPLHFSHWLHGNDRRLAL